MASKPPGGAQLINSHEDLLTAFANIDQRLHRIIEGDAIPYIYRNKLYLPASMYNIYLGSIGSGGERNTAADSSGRQPVKEENASGIYSRLGLISDLHASRPPRHGQDTFAADTAAKYAAARIIATPIELAGGASTNNVLFSAVGSYTAHVAITGINADSADTYICTFQDEDDAALAPLPNRIDFVVGTAYVPTMLAQPVYFSAGADDKDIEVDVSGGAGTEKLTVFGWGWLET